MTDEKCPYCKYPEFLIARDVLATRRCNLCCQKWVPGKIDRTKEQIDGEYAVEAAHAGDMEFKIKLFTAQLEVAYKQMGALNEEARQMKAVCDVSGVKVDE